MNHDGRVKVKTISVHIRYYGVLPLYIGVKNEALDIPDGTTVAEIMQVLINRNSNIFNQIIGDSDISKSALRIFRNETLLTAVTFSDYAQDGDKFKIIPAVSGG